MLYEAFRYKSNNSVRPYTSCMEFIESFGRIQNELISKYTDNDTKVSVIPNQRLHPCISNKRRHLIPPSLLLSHSRNCYVLDKNEQKKTSVDKIKDSISSLRVDSQLGWDQVGGCEKHIDTLKECVMLPLLYPELYEHFSMLPARGLILYGPPGL